MALIKWQEKVANRHKSYYQRELNHVLWVVLIENGIVHGEMHLIKN
jgi:hypothetical protein